MPARIHKDTVLMEEPLIHENQLSEKETVSVISEEEREGFDNHGFTDDIKSELLKQQQDNYAYSVLDITEQNLYVEILYALENEIEEMKLSTRDPEEIDKIFQCVLLDHPEIFYADGYSFVKYTYGDEVRKVTFTGNYIYRGEEIRKKQEQITAGVSDILSGIPRELSDYEKVKRVYEEVIYRTEYSTKAKDNQNICSVFLENSSVCQGYAKAVQYLLQQLSIPATMVVGTVENGEGHAWNLVRIDNRYYHVDATWGDASYLVEKEEGEIDQSLKGINYDYLCVTTGEISQTHTIDNVVPIPVCDSREANYYVREGAYFEEFNEEQLVRLIERYQSEGRESFTVKCATKEVYREISYLLLEEQKIFEYLEHGENSIVYTDSAEQLSLTFWLS